ncbi:hypothetical protein MUP79_00525 [Candidatus Bathyarchaeota archaeon]|nr:hypothetical protein [Candidatus Bathyarchaeota archaeon]
MSSSEKIAQLFNCCSSIEQQVFTLYKLFSERVHDPYTKSLLLYIAYDSLKHSTLLSQGLGVPLENLEQNVGDCEPQLWKTWQTHVSFYAVEREFNDQTLVSEANRLERFENVFLVEYYLLINRIAEFEKKSVTNWLAGGENRLDLESFTDLFNKIAEDEKHHIRILQQIQQRGHGEFGLSTSPFSEIDKTEDPVEKLTS